MPNNSNEGKGRVIDGEELEAKTQASRYQNSFETKI